MLLQGQLPAQPNEQQITRAQVWLPVATGVHKPAAGRALSNTSTTGAACRRYLQTALLTAPQSIWASYLSSDKILRLGCSSGHPLGRVAACSIDWH